MTFARLRRGDWLALVAALALLLVMSLDWYSTETGEQARKDAAQTEPQGGPVSNETARAIDEDAEIVANRAEKNAWQAEGFADRLVLFALLATVALAIAAAFMRAADVRLKPPWSPSALTTVVGLGAVLLLAARIVQKPTADLGAVVKLGAPLGLVCVGVVAIGARTAWKGEGAGEEEGAAEAPPAEPPPAAVRPRPAPLFAQGEPVSEWAPDWSDPAPGPAEPGPASTDDSGRRGRRARRGKGKRRRDS